MKLKLLLLVAILMTTPSAWAEEDPHASEIPLTQQKSDNTTEPAPSLSDAETETGTEPNAPEDEDESLFSADTVKECDSAYLEAVMFCSTGDSNMFCVRQRLRELVKCVTRVKNTPVCTAYQKERDRCKIIANPLKREECKAEARMQTQWLDCHR